VQAVTAKSRRQPAPPIVTRPVIAPVAAERFKVQFTVGRETHDKLRRVEDLLRHSVPDVDVAVRHSAHS
jgi:hypothetical protein